MSSAPSTSTDETCAKSTALGAPDGGIRLGAVPESAFRRTPSPQPSVRTDMPDRSDGQDGRMEIVSIREKHGVFRKAVPRMPVPVAVLLCLLNVVLPGTGTLLSGFCVLCGCPTEHGEVRRSFLCNMCAALLQLLLCPIIVGWVWSVLWGITFVNISVSQAVENNDSGGMV